jgi:hypothetical protein
VARRRRVTSFYPPLDALVSTLRRSKTSLAGARRFYAGEGLFVFADGKTGIANVAGRVYLPPAAYDELGNFLDHTPTPAVLGFCLSTVPDPSTSLPELAQTALAAFDAAARHSMHRAFDDEGREIVLQSIENEASRGWSWEGSLHYEDVYTLEGGNHIFRETCVRVLARPASDGDVEIAVVTTQAGDREAASAWLNRINRGRWLIQPVSLPTADGGRLSAVEAILGKFGYRLQTLKSPDVYAGGGSDKAGFLKVLKRAAYETGMTDLETIADRMQNVDRGTLGALQLFLWERGRRAITSIELRQRPNESYVRVTWRGGRDYDVSSLDLTDSVWDGATPVDWSAERKREYLLEAWDDVLAGLAGAEAALVHSATA